MQEKYTSAQLLHCNLAPTKRETTMPVTRRHLDTWNTSKYFPIKTNQQVLCVFSSTGSKRVSHDEQYCQNYRNMLSELSEPCSTMPLGLAF